MLNMKDINMEELQQELDKIQSLDINDDDWAKIRGETIPGYYVIIEWGSRPNVDYGYCFSLPNQTPDEGDVFIHVTNVDNSDGMDNAPDVWIHLYNLITNKMVEKVSFREIKSF